MSVTRVAPWANTGPQSDCHSDLSRMPSQVKEYTKNRSKFHLWYRIPIRYARLTR
jgi:hypothetical protein